MRQFHLSEARWTNNAKEVIEGRFPNTKMGKVVSLIFYNTSTGDGKGHQIAGDIFRVLNGKAPKGVDDLASGRFPSTRSGKVAALIFHNSNASEEKAAALAGEILKVNKGEPITRFDDLTEPEPREPSDPFDEGAPVGMANVGPIIRQFGPVISRGMHDDDLSAAYERGRRYISGGALPGDEQPSSTETAPAPLRFQRLKVGRW